MSESDGKKLRKAMRGFDWLVRVYAPAFLRMAKLDAHAETLEKLHKILKVEDSTYVHVCSEEMRRELEAHAKELCRTEGRLPEGLPHSDPAYKQVTELFGQAGLENTDFIWGGIDRFAADIWTVADRAALIANVSVGVTRAQIDERRQQLEQELSRRLGAVA